jgi:hypothetical protein
VPSLNRAVVAARLVGVDDQLLRHVLAGDLAVQLGVDRAGRIEQVPDRVDVQRDHTVGLEAEVDRCGPDHLLAGEGEVRLNVVFTKRWASPAGSWKGSSLPVSWPQ